MEQNSKKIVLSVLYSACLPIVAALACLIWISDWRFQHEPFHSFLESLGTFTAFLIAAIILLSHKHKRLSPIYLWVASALIGMGVLDGYHAASHAGNTFVWLHSMAALIGGLVFAMVILPNNIAKHRYAIYFPVVILILSISLGWFSISYPELIPAMIDENGFSFLAQLINFIGGAGFTISWIYFSKLFFKHKEIDKLLLGGHCLLFGVSSFIFELSILWDATWWLWHILRLFAYFIVLYYFLVLYNQSVKKYRILFQDNPTMLFSVDDQGKIISANEAAATELGYQIEELINKIIFQTYKDNDQEKIRSHFDACLSQPEAVHHWEIQKLKQDGSDIWVKETARTIIDEDNKANIFIVCENITEKRELALALSYQASHDKLTGLVNRDEFEKRTRRLLTDIKKSNNHHVFCYIDLDKFKIINDTCGHSAGDELLRQLGKLFKSIIRDRDTLARLGGDEFGVLFQNCSIKDAYRVTSSLLSALQDFQFSWENHVFRLGMSIGLIGIDNTNNNLSEILKNADAACYTAKNKGRNQIVIYESDNEEIAQLNGEIKWLDLINNALVEDKFVLYAQTIESTKINRGKQYEILLRMLDENGKTILPGAFMPAAVRYNLSSKIDIWVFKKAIELLKINPQFRDDLEFIAINLSGHSLTDPAFLNILTEELSNNKHFGSKICFEITETATVTNLMEADKFICSLRKYGCKFILDDFGSGLSSFSYLKQLSVDFVKIDGMFVKDIINDPINRAMVKSINDIGQVMGLKTIAEFVENNATKEMVCKIGVDYTQGYAIQKPEPFLEIINKNVGTDKTSAEETDRLDDKCTSESPSERRVFIG